MGALAAVVLAGCALPPGALDAPFAVNLHVATTPTSIEIDGPGWFAPVSDLYLCPVEPPPLPEPGAERLDWGPGPPCRAYGSQESGSGLLASLPLDVLDASPGSPWLAAPDWYLLVVDVRDGRATSAFRTRFGRPTGWPAP